MPKVAIKTSEKTSAAPPPPSAEGVEARVYFEGDAHPIHLRQYSLAAGAKLRLAAQGADLAVFVWKGAVETPDARLDPQSSAVIQNGAELALTGGAEGGELLVFNMRENGKTGTAGNHVYLLPYEKVPRTFAMGGTEGVGGALHADASDPTTDIWLHENSYKMADKETALHSHSEDEVIFVLGGSIRLGNRTYGPGTALAVAADTVYGFWSGPDGLAFVNFRGASPTYTTADGKTVLDEAELWRKAVGRPEYLEVTAA